MIGRILNHYEIVDKLGEGGMGVVYKARDVALDRVVAIKVLPPDKLRDAEMLHRFRREAKAASALNHPNLVTIYEIGSHDGIEFLAMEYVEGRTLFSILQDGRLPISTVLSYAEQIAGAMAKAHAAGIIHRDLKPGNIMITADGLVKILDFGLARLQSSAHEISDAPQSTAFMTRLGMVMGTVTYMSPEQARGGEVDGRSDIFSLGIITYEMLSGALPFAGATEMAVLHNLHFETPAPLKRSEVPAALEQVISRMLEKNVNLRYQSMLDVRRDLRAFDNASSAPTKLLDIPTKRAVHWRRMPVLASGLLGAAALAVVATQIPWVGSPPARPEQSVEPQADSGAETSQKLYARARLLLDRFDRSENVDSAIRLLEKAVEKDPSYALGYATLAEAYRYKNKLSPDAQWRNLIEQSASRALELNSDLAAAHIAKSLAALESASRASEAEKHLLRAIELDPRNHAAHKWMGVMWVFRKDFDKAEASFKRSEELNPRDWTTFIEHGIERYLRGNYSGAAKVWETSLNLSPDNIRVLANLAAAYHMLDRYEEAASTLQRAIEIQPVPAHYNNLGTLRFFQGRYTDAVPAFEKAIEKNPNRYSYWGNLADAYRWSPGNKSKAGEAYRRGIQLVNEQLALKPHDADLHSTLALYQSKSGDKAAALRELAALEAASAKGDAALFRMTVAYELCGKRDDALRTLEASLKAGYAEREIRNDPELLSLRNDIRYHRLMSRLATKH